MFEIAIILVLLVLGYSVGRYRESRHYQSIRDRESEFSSIMVFESRQLPEKGLVGGGELVQGNVVVSTDYFKMFVAGLRMLVGGRLTTYETLLDRGRREAVLRMKEQARSLGANRVFNCRFETASISKGAEGSLGSVEVLVYGTAVKAV